MAAPACLLSILCMLVLAPAFTLATSSALARVNLNAGESVVEATCNATSDPLLCTSLLRSEPRSRTAPDAKALSMVALEIADRDATNISSYASSLIDGSSGAALGTTLSMCSAKYWSAAEALRLANESLAADNKDHASVNVTAAKDFTDACRKIFFQDWPGVTYPEGLAKQDNLLMRFCDVIVDIISTLV